MASPRRLSDVEKASCEEERPEFTERASWEGEWPQTMEKASCDEDQLDTIEKASCVGERPEVAVQPAPSMAQVQPPDYFHDIPDGGYGWICLLSVFMINCFTWGVAATYGVFLAYYLENNVFPEATPLDYAFIGGLNFGMAMGVASPGTILVRRFDVHAPMLCGVVLMSGGYIAASFATRIWQLYLSQGVCVGLGLGLMFVPSVAVIPQWFHKKRSLATGITSSGSGIGGIIFSFATQALIKHASFRWALRVTGILLGVMNTIATIILRSRNGTIQPNLRAFDLKLFRNFEVLLLLGWGFTSMLGYMNCLYSLPDFSLSIGLTPSQGATISALLNLGTALGRPAVGFLSDRFGRFEIAVLFTFVCCITVFAEWLPSRSYGVTIFYALSNGPILGLFWQTVTPLCTEVVGLKELPSLLAIMWAFIILPVTFSEVIVLEIRRPDLGVREYLYPQIYSGTSYLVAGCLLFWLWLIHRKRKIAEGQLPPRPWWQFWR